MSNTPAKIAYDMRRSTTTHRTSVRLSLELWKSFKGKCDRNLTTPHAMILEFIAQWVAEE